jgi:hypothetical protein
MASGKAIHYNAHKRYLLTLELKHVLCMSPEELEEAEQEDAEEAVAGLSESGDTNDSEDDDSDGGGSSSDGDNEHIDGDDMDEESLVIAREMTDDQRDLDEQQQLEGELSSEHLLVPDESELIPGDAVVSLIAIPAPWEPWEQEQEQEGAWLGPEGQQLTPGKDKELDFDLDIDPRDGLSALRPPMSRSEGSSIMHGNAITHEDSG